MFLKHWDKTEDTQHKLKWWNHQDTQIFYYFWVLSTSYTQTTCKIMCYHLYSYKPKQLHMKICGHHLYIQNGQMADINHAAKSLESQNAIYITNLNQISGICTDLPVYSVQKY